LGFVVLRAAHHKTGRVHGTGPMDAPGG
jgi:hypothetical protein